MVLPAASSGANLNFGTVRFSVKSQVYGQLLGRQLHAWQLLVHNFARWPWSRRRLLARTIARNKIDRPSIALASINSKNDCQGFI